MSPAAACDVRTEEEKLRTAAPRIHTHQRHQGVMVGLLVSFLSEMHPFWRNAPRML